MRVKIIGAGSIGNHLSHAARSLNWSVDLMDCDDAALERTRTQIYPSRYGAWDEAIQLFTPDLAPKGGYDLICIGTPPDSHMALALQSLEENPKAVLIEKPVCTPALEHAHDLLSTAHAQGCMLFAGYDHVVGDAANRFCELIEQNTVGKALTLDVEFREHWEGIFAAHPWLDGPTDSYLGYWRRGGGATSEHSHGLNLWQHFAHRLDLGRVTQVTATLDYVQKDGADYDRLCLASLSTGHGFLGRVAQDVLTTPTRKWARLQGEDGFIEWICGYQLGVDAVKFSSSGKGVTIETFAKARPDDFLYELKHIAAVMNGGLASSNLAIERGLDTMMVVAAAHHSSQEKKTISIDWSKGYSADAFSS